MKYSVEKEEKYTVLKVEEEKLDANVAPELKTELVTFNTEGVKNMVLDMSSVKYTDSSGLSAILRGNKLCQDSGGEFVLCGINDHVMKLIKISQLDSTLTILNTREEAIERILMNSIEEELNESSEDSEQE